ncbi:TRAP transporter small permease [Jeotgalibaca dankookensis]|uniref:TRAP transporter small permease n=1 Tax=Jeotgalibaca dankookensis TaxID=708126 RepID=UPI000783DDEE|nr:TRAP transporter small permease [Jeotgalibaca dankookensis]
MNKVRFIIDKVMRIFCAVAFASMVLLTVWQVLTRYILNSPSTWSEELASYIFAWVTILGAAYVFGKREHMAIPIFVELFPIKTQRILAIISEIIILIFAVVILVYGGISITLLGMGQLSSSLGIQMGVFYSVIPISGVFTAIYSILNIYDLSTNNV